jgi:uncharacterized membrane protein HdeD (DUF308 family)
MFAACRQWAECSPGHNRLTSETGDTMIILGVILLIIGAIANISILWVIGIILVVVGAILALLGMLGRPVGGRKYYY